MRRVDVLKWLVVPVTRHSRRRLVLLTCVLLGCRQDDASDRPGRASDAAATLQSMSRQWTAVPVTSFHEQPSCFAITIGSPSASCRDHVPPGDAALARYARLASTTARRLRTSRTPTDLQTIAVLQLTVDARDRAALASAGNSIDEAAEDDSAPAAVLIDQAAMHLQHYAVSREMRNLLTGMHAAALASERAPQEWRACWNHAVALAWAGLRMAGEREWARCRPLIPREAAARVTRVDLTAPAGRVDSRDAWHEATRDLAWNTVLPSWSHALAAGDSAARTALEPRVDSVVRLVQRSGIDPALGAFRDELVRAASTRDTRQVRTLAAATTAYARARSAEGKQNPSAVRRELDLAVQTVPRASAIRPWLLLERANQELIIGRGATALQLYRQLDTSAAPPMYRNRVAYSTALALASTGRTAESVDRLVAVEHECRALRLEDCAVGAPTMTAFYASMIGDIETTERAAGRAVGALAHAPMSQWHWSTATLLRQLAQLHGLTHAVASLDREAVAIATRLGRADLGALNAQDAAQAALDRGDLAEARRQVVALREHWLPRQSSDDQRQVQVDLLRLDGELLRATDAQRSLRLLDSALALARRDDIDARMTPLRLARARTMLAAGDTLDGLTELDALLITLRRRGGADGTVFDVARLARVLTRTAEVSAHALRARGDVRGALRALSGLPRLDAGRKESDIPACCTNGGALPLAVRLIGDSAWIFSRSGGSWSLRTTFLPAQLVRSAIALDSVSLAHAHAALIDSAALRRATSICIDARGAAADMPWSALRDPGTGRHLIEMVAVRLVGDVMDGCPREMPWVRSSTVVLIDAAPDTGSRALPAARQEVATLQALWGSSVARIVDARRGSDAVVAAMSRSAMVHFAGHAILDRTRPDRSYLLLHGAADSSLAGDEIARTRMPVTRLVVLSACETRGGVAGALSGFDTLAGAFLDAGAHEVIGAGWPVDDAPTATFMTGLHAALQRGLAPAAALRDAQVVALRSSDSALRSPRVWAAFQIMGAGGRIR